MVWIVSSMQICLAISAFLARALSYFSNSASTLRWSAVRRAMASWVFLAGMWGSLVGGATLRRVCRFHRSGFFRFLALLQHDSRANRHLRLALCAVAREILPRRAPAEG